MRKNYALVALVNFLIIAFFFGGAGYAVFVLGRSSNWMWAAFFLCIFCCQKLPSKEDEDA